MRNTDYILDAAIFAVEAHGKQTRKVSLPNTKVPYVVHPLRVGRMLSRWGYDAETVIGGILHDTIEDTPTTYEDLDRNFGKCVANLVAMCSDDKTAPWEEVCARNIEHISTTHDAGYFAIKLADNIDNMRDVANVLRWCANDGERQSFVWDKFKHHKEEKRAHHDMLFAAFLHNRHMEDGERTERINEFGRLCLSVYHSNGY